MLSIFHREDIVHSPEASVSSLEENWASFHRTQSPMTLWKGNMTQPLLPPSAGSHSGTIRLDDFLLLIFFYVFVLDKYHSNYGTFSSNIKVTFFFYQYNILFHFPFFYQLRMHLIKWFLQEMSRISK
jgi:hypothetical protein